MKLGWLADFTKPFSTMLNAIAERFALSIGHRKPNLYVHFNPVQTIWCIAQMAQRSGPPIELMQAMSWADICHDDPKQTLIIVNAYPDGTEPEIGALDKIAIPPGTVINQQLSAFVLPIKGKKGQPWVGRFVLVDQFQRKYKTKKVKFKWAGPVEKGNGGA